MEDEMGQLIENIKSARMSGVPLIAVESQDQPATLDAVSTAIENAAHVVWDCINGLRHQNPAGELALKDLGADVLRDSPRIVNALRAALKLPKGAMLYLYNSHAFMNEPPAVQGIQNLREAFKESKRMLVMLGPSFADMRTELQADVIVLQEPLPTEEQLGALITDLHEAADKVLDKAKLPGMVDALRGLPALFTAEQVAAMSFRKAGLDMDALWERKEAAINATKGLTITRSTTKYADLAGMDTIQTFLKRYQSGPRPFRLVLFWDEIEKMMAGAGGEAQDSSGVSSDFLGVCLKMMEEMGWAGLILLGVPGSGKTALGDATSGEFNVPRISMDFGAMKGKFVGDSESAVRTAFNVVKALGGEDVLVIATCNRLKNLPPEFRRRFWLGNWYYDVPTVEEQEPIKRIYEKKFGCGSDWPDTTDWTGAEIRNCARLTQRLGCSLREAGEYVVPIAKADPDSLEQLRAVADGRFLSVSKPGTWSMNKPEAATAQKKTTGKRSFGS
jgi:hypothetical protein